MSIGLNVSHLHRLFITKSMLIAEQYDILLKEVKRRSSCDCCMFCGTRLADLSTQDTHVHLDACRSLAWDGTSSQQGDNSRVLKPGSICEECFDAPAMKVQNAPWGGDMGVCTQCAVA